MRVLSQVQRAINTLRAPIVADRLRDGKDMGLGKGAHEWGTAVAARAETDELIRILYIGIAVEILSLELRRIHQHLHWNWFSCQRRDLGLALERAGA